MEGTLDGFEIGALAGRCYLLDTNVLLHDATALLAFDEHNIILTVDILEELDRFKRENDERGRNARYVIRTIDELRRSGNFRDGIPLSGGGKLFVMVDTYVEHLPRGMDVSRTDNRILAAAFFLQKSGVDIIFVSKDINARVKGEILGLPTEDLLRSSSNSKQTALGIFRADSGRIETLKHYESRPWGIQALNLQQHFALELLLRPDIELVTMLGQAGTGKTLLALAAGLHQVAEKKLYRRIMVSRPVIPLGRDIGYLPGTKEEKLENWMGPVQDNLNFLVDPQLEQTSEKIDYLFATGMIEMEAVTYIRGRSLPGLFILIDEAQNLTPHEVKTAVSRAGKDTKVVLTGDAYQIDNPYLDASSNGLTYVVERFKGQSLYGHITLSKSERSHLASLAAELL